MWSKIEQSDLFYNHILWVYVAKKWKIIIHLKIYFTIFDKKNHEISNSNGKSIGINKVFENGTLDIKDKYSFDFPPITSQFDWEMVLTTFWNDAKKMIHYIENLTDNDLNATFVEPKYGNYSRNIDAMIEHSYYHLGQIVLLKKMI